MKFAFERHPGEYGPARFEQVWLWSEWPEKADRGFRGQDTGIDLVALQTDGRLCAIQCKFYRDGSTVPITGINSFLATSGTGDFDRRILVITGKYSVNAWTTIEKARPRCEVITTSDLNGWSLRWADFLDDPADLRFDHTRYTPHRFQERAVSKVAEGFERSDRGKLILPCGTGKSVVSLWAAERIVGVGGRVLYLVPSIALMGQTMREWSRQRDPDIPHRYIGICSDVKAGRTSEDASLTELAMPVTTDPDQIATQLAIPSTEAMTVVFCTYQSLELVGDAQEMLDDVDFDLIICDEAHRTTGIDQTKKGEVSGFRLVHNEGRIRGWRRLFMTATPRIYQDTPKKKAEASGMGVYSMDDPDLYGPEFYRMDFAKAVEADHLTDYKVVSEVDHVTESR